MHAQEIEHYLAELGASLQNQGIIKPVRLLLIGGAYMMLLANAPRTTGQAPPHRLRGLVKRSDLPSEN